MSTRLRILIASPLGRVVEPALARTPGVAVVNVAVNRQQVQAAISSIRFDVVVTDLIWNRPELEHTFDGLDVVDMLATVDRDPRVLLASQCNSMERDHLDEARRLPAVVGVFEKTTGLEALIDAIRAAAVPQRTVFAPEPDSVPPLYELFRTKHGATAARMAGAIASGRASNLQTLADALDIPLNTANKVTNVYLGPIMRKRAEHAEHLPLTLPAVFRWCGLHSRYLQSWCRRNGYEEVLRG